MAARSRREAAWKIPIFVRSILSRLHRAGHQAYIVGGAVRDLCMGRPATDWDVATSASAEEIKSIFKDLRSFSLKHETVTLVQKGRPYEVTTFRGPDQTLEEDLKRRDFTINAMAYDMERSLVIDPWGGRRDIAKAMVRGVVSPEERFREDPLRLMRAVRMAAELGFRVERKTLKAISSMAGAITTVAPERIRDELVKVLLCEKPSQGLHLLRKTGLLGYILPELAENQKIKETGSQAAALGRRTLAVVDQVAPDPGLRLAALFCIIARGASSEQERKGEEAVRPIMLRLCFSKSMIRRVIRLVQEHEALAAYDSSWSDGDLRRFISRAGADQVKALIALRRAGLPAWGGRSSQKLRRLNEIQKRMRALMKAPLVSGPQELAISGSEVMKATGLCPGPEVGAMLKRLSEQLMDHPEWNTRKRLLAMVKNMKPFTLPDHPKGFGKGDGTAGPLKTTAEPKS